MGLSPYCAEGRIRIKKTEKKIKQCGRNMHKFLTINCKKDGFICVSKIGHSIWVTYTEHQNQAGEEFQLFHCYRLKE